MKCSNFFSDITEDRNSCREYTYEYIEYLGNNRDNNINNNNVIINYIYI